MTQISHSRAAAPMTPEAITETLDRHRLWLARDDGGVRADLTDAILRGADLTDAVLTDADLRDADLRGANLSGAVLHGADFGRANLTGADLGGARFWDLRATPRVVSPPKAPSSKGKR